MTSLLRELTPDPIRDSASSTMVWSPAIARARAQASPITPAPTTMQSECSKTTCSRPGPDDTLSTEFPLSVPIFRPTGSRPLPANLRQSTQPETHERARTTCERRARRARHAVDLLRPVDRQEAQGDRHAFDDAGEQSERPPADRPGAGGAKYGLARIGRCGAGGPARCDFR